MTTTNTCKFDASTFIPNLVELRALLTKFQIDHNVCAACMVPMLQALAREQWHTFEQMMKNELPYLHQIHGGDFKRHAQEQLAIISVLEKELAKEPTDAPQGARQ